MNLAFVRVNFITGYRSITVMAPSQQHRDYRTDFKLAVLNHKRQLQASSTEVALHFQIPSSSTIWDWEQRYNQGGATALTNL